MKKLKVILIGAFIAALCVLDANAQEKDDEIKIKVIKETESGKEVFEKTYKNEREMKEDPEYQEFFGSDDPIIFSFRGPNPPVRFHMDHLGEDMERLMEDFEDIHIDFDSEEFEKIHQKVRVEIERGTRDIEKHLKNLEEQLEDIDREEIEAELQKLKESLERNRIIRPDRPEAFDRVSISDVKEDDFGRKAVVKDSEKLELEDMRTMLNSSYGLLDLRFTVPSQDKLSVKIFDKNMEEQFSQVYSSFGGIYREKIKLHSFDEGKYLLEVVSGDKRLTKKIELFK